ncbi:MAG: hypothetical protein ACK5M4_05075, partial [Pseudorhodobacter sp.]
AQSNRAIVFCSSSGGAQAMRPDWEFEYIRCYLTTGGTRTLRKEISVNALGSIAAINADSWKLGGDVS